ncbi:adenosylcobinamide-GDP ribazoletransferase [Aneurinibacillus terranovensis]|uniref:adenosylcobinamide-GDP ribazoletransferase n=1 Tax=Aneurinibacillus terranovensis TaxID=278991 RepID=UPI00040A1219|nr:adenosylcobinamide-GDP ribazoletransferase [Aneurinibacillus terranovensis]
MNPLLHAIAFLTRIPVPYVSHSTKDWEKSVAYYPFVGLLIGVLLWGAGMLLAYLFPLPVAAVLTMAFWVFITGGLHVDGWMDLADGLGSNRPKEKVFEIMKDSRVGAMGVIAALLLFMVKGTTLYEAVSLHRMEWLIISPFIARFCLIMAIWFWPYITEKGIGTGLRNGLTAINVGVGFLFTGCIVYWIGRISGLAVFIMTIAGAVFFIRMIVKKLGGLTGDCYGAVVEWTEMAALVLLLLMKRWIG